MPFNRTKNLKLSTIKQIEIRASEYPDVVSLAQGIPSFDTPPCIKRRVERALDRGVVAKYSLSPGLPELRELIEIMLAKDNIYYDWEKEIIVTVGSIEGITASILAITKPGDEIIIPEPTYTSYREVINLAGCRPVYVALDETKDWAFDLSRFGKAITKKTRAILYCNPNNPTGTIYTKEQLLGLAQLAKKHDLFLISDEVYKDFVFNNEKIFSLAEVPELRKKIIRIFSFSKVYAMTGWRLGYLHSDESVTKEILKVHDSLVTCAPVISQYAGLGAMEMAEKDVIKFNQEYKIRRNLICERLDKLNHVFSYVKPESAYYVFPKILTKEKDSWKFTLDLLDKTQVALVPGVAFGPSGEGHVRMSFGRSQKDINRAFDRLDEYFKNF
ncbi:aminotransferase [Candidatus Falkowbacteria bacterium CG11_big_fil_rev_8_21_14_0_20_39_10]|uniref:Aminotransferase n=1 Tax=Candidatus Falkowbacteria bacterium CG11_big_fil_rev_8_21_14_0_20_39_10 TaxID=1974570 RepID=A0A2M6K843_9BACT|nr:MAG: aminotransferase [Candidatus Falkowbacteria bacterium CG11_big_fil_rev_8_21_14_0_20_39_10]